MLSVLSFLVLSVFAVPVVSVFPVGSSVLSELFFVSEVTVSAAPVPPVCPSSVIVTAIFISPHVNLESSRSSLTTTVCCPADNPDTSIVPLSVESFILSMSDSFPLTTTAVLSTPNVSF